MRKNSVKNTRINGEVQKELANLIRGEIKDPRISPWTSVVSVEVSPDLKTCKAWISVLGGEDEIENTLKGLNSAEGFIRREYRLLRYPVPASCQSLQIQDRTRSLLLLPSHRP